MNIFADECAIRHEEQFRRNTTLIHVPARRVPTRVYHPFATFINWKENADFCPIFCFPIASGIFIAFPCCDEIGDVMLCRSNF